jgi:O-antigen ligase
LEIYTILYLVGSHIFNPVMQGLFIFLCIATLLLLFKRPILLNGYTKYMGLFILFAFISTIWAADKASAMASNMTFLLCALWGFCVYIQANSKEKINKLLFCFLLGSIVLDLYCVSVLGINGIIRLASQELRLGLESGTELNSNYIGSTNAIAALIGVYLTISHKRKIVIVFPLICAAFVLLSASRGAVIVLAFGLVVYALFTHRKNKRFRVPLYAGLGIIAVLAAYNLGLLDIVLDRFKVASNSINIFLSGDRTSNASNIRLRLIFGGLSLFAKRPLLGYGSGQFNRLISSILGFAYSPHNAYTQSMVGYGVMGLLLWQGMYIRILKNTFKDRKNSLAMIVLVIVCAWLINDLFDHSISNKTSYYLLAIGFSAIGVLKKEDYTEQRVEGLADENKRNT